jgi:exodeoxyribonuclease VII large subunit
LAAFNDERIARAIFTSAVPVVSAVGHEVDTTIADLVADVRAPTPSAAAEMIVPDREDLRREIGQLTRQLAAGTESRLGRARAELVAATQQLERRSPRRVMEERRHATDELVARGRRAAENRIRLARSAAEAARLQLSALSPYTTLRRGYAICTRADDGSVVTGAEQVAVTELVNVRLARGQLMGRVVQQTPTALPGDEPDGK